MSELIQLRKKSQLTLPHSIMKELGIEEGDFLDISVKGDTALIRVKKLVDKEHAWFWTRKWQHGEMEAEEDIKAGRVRDFKSAGEAIEYLHDSKRKNRDKKAGRGD